MGATKRRKVGPLVFLGAIETAGRAPHNPPGSSPRDAPVAGKLPAGHQLGERCTMAVRFQLAKADAVAWLQSLPAGCADLLITDPPYESLEKHRAIGTTTRLKHSKASSNGWVSIFPNVRVPEVFQ